MKLQESYHDDLIKRLKDPELAKEYLNAALEDDDKRVFLLALRNVAEAHGGMTTVSRITGISREHIYRALSERGNPEFATLQALLEAFGFKLSIDQKPRKKRAA